VDSILIISDSHGLRTELSMIAKRHHFSGMIHCGDSELPEDAPELDGFLKVAGNCDMDSRYPDEQLQLIGNWKFLITHGHLNQVKSSLLPLTYRSEEVGADVICFGHTHIAGAEEIDGKLYINPGSIHLPKGKYGKTYAIATFQGDAGIDVSFHSLNGERVQALTYHYKVK